MQKQWRRARKERMRIPMTMSWLERFRKNIVSVAGGAVARDVMGGSEKLGLRPTPSRRAEWMKGALEKLEGSVGKEKAKRILTATCPHAYPRTRIEKMRKLYNEVKSIDALLDAMNQDTSYGGVSYYDCPQRKGKTIYITKVPCNPGPHKKNSTPLEKKLLYCHCGWARAALKTNRMFSPIFCYCSTSWDRQLWEGILGKPVLVEVVKSLLLGDDCCVHVLHIPEGVPY